MLRITNSDLDNYIFIKIYPNDYKKFKLIRIEIEIKLYNI